MNQNDIKEMKTFDTMRCPSACPFCKKYPHIPPWADSESRLSHWLIWFLVDLSPQWWRP